LPAAAHDQPEKRTISISASGTVKTTPDMVEIATGVTSEAPSGRAALDQNTEAMTKVVEALKGDGIEPKDIQTANFSVGPIYEQRPYDRPDGRPPAVVGYRVTNQVRITLRDTAKLGAILDKVVSLGANQIDSIEFGVSQPEALKDEARKLALKNVTDNAKLYAQAAGVTLGPILAITEEESSYQPRYMPSAATMEAKAVPIEAGTAAVEVRVRVSWEID
ncbi:MAG TPA: SIMPL domain-containing protein, partial [Methyloceanibacter sp.]|nr:SIMPL domain-containing protein [Methyloceanibacter sp.]